jgi:hypothetical protein
MINSALHKNPVALDRALHLKLRMRPELNDLAGASALNSFFLNGVEFADACKEYPIVFVRAGTDAKTGKGDIAPVAVFGLSPAENLFLEGGRWKADYVPAVLRAYPFAMAPVSGDNYAVCIDQAWPGFSETEGTPLFEADGQPTQYLKDVQKYLETLEAEAQRTRQFCQRVSELGLLRDMRFDATLPEGNKLPVDGFLAIDNDKFLALPDSTVLELHRNGILSLLHAQQVSMGNMTRLLNRKLARVANA